MTVRRVDMQRFILAVRATEEPRYYSPEEITPDMYGRRVLIVGGPLDGLEGRLLKARGTSGMQGTSSRSRRPDLVTSRHRMGVNTSKPDSRRSLYAGILALARLILGSYTQYKIYVFLKKFAIIWYS